MKWPPEAYSVQLKRKVDMDESSIELVTMKNGRHMLRGVAAHDPSIKLVLILGKASLEEARAKLGVADA